MFERYAERARRVVFFARYEASQLGAESIQPEHLVLGLFREDKDLVDKCLFSHAASEEVRKQIEERFEKREKISTSVDLPLDANSKRVLGFAAEEAPASGEIRTAHLLLGILRLENHFAAEILQGRGLSLENVRRELKGVTPKGSLKKARSKPTACRDCRHLIVDVSTEAIEWMNLFCGASPTKPIFDCYTGEPVELKPDSPLAERFGLCRSINFGECTLFEPKEGQSHGPAATS